MTLIGPLGNARALAEEGQLAPRSVSSANSNKLGEIDTSLSPSGMSATSPLSSALQPPSPTPNKRASLTPGGTTKVLADLQAGVINARNALENTKAQLRLSQRTVAQLTRQTEDLKEGRERLRLENEGLNNVVARKERLLQEVCSPCFFNSFVLIVTGSGTGSQSRNRSDNTPRPTETRVNNFQEKFAGNGVGPGRIDKFIPEIRT